MEKGMDRRPERLDQLAAAARAGDRSAYRAFLAEAAECLRGYVGRRLGRGPDMEDVVQECLIALHEKSATLDLRRHVAPWMYAIARYKLADHWRRSARQPATIGELPELAVPPDEFAGRDVAALLDRLPPAQSEAIRLTRIEGMTGREAGRAAGISASAMKLRAHRAMIALRELAAKDR